MPKDKVVIATMLAQGMLAHPKRYKPRAEDAHMDWHDAIATEAFDLADAIARVAASRDMHLED